MNILNKWFLKIALLPKGLYKQFGVDIFQLQAILTTKLIIDDRRPNTLHQTQRKKREKPITAATLGTIFISAFLGLVYLIAFIFGDDIVTQLTFYFSFFFLMLSASLITDFTSVLMDAKDNFIILPKPVNDKTVVVARILHIFIHVCKIIIPMSLPGFVYMIYSFGLTKAIVFVLMVILLTLFAIFFINALYILILRITTPQKFQSIISYVQIIFAIIIYASSQLFPRLISQMEGFSFNAADAPFIVLLPSFWFACGWHFFTQFSGNTAEIIAAVFSILIPLVSIYVVIKVLAPFFSKKLAAVSSTSGESTKKVDIRKEKNNWSYANFLSSSFTRKGAEQMGFLFTWKMTARSRDFKMKVYPGIGYLIVYAVVIFLNNKNLSIDKIQEEAIKGSTSGKIMVLSLLYFGSLLLIMAVNQMVYSEKFKAAWIFFITPVKNPGEIILGGIKAAILKFYLPLVLLCSIAGIYVAGVSILANIILGLFNALLIAAIIAYVSKRHLPFTVFESNQSRSGSFIRNLSALIISGFIAILHFFIYNFTIVVIIFSVLSVLATWLIMESIRTLTWQKLIKEINKED